MKENVLEQLLDEQEFGETENEVTCECLTDDSPAAVMSANKIARTYLVSLVQEANDTCSCGYTPDETDRMVNSLLYVCDRQVKKERNMTSPLHRDVAEAASTMYVLGKEKLMRHKFDPAKANFGTFMSTVFTNACCSEYEKKNRDGGTFAASFDKKVSDNEDSLSLGDIIGNLDLSFDQKYFASAKMDAFKYVMDFAADHLSDVEYKIFLLHGYHQMDNDTVAQQLGMNKKAVENGYYRAVKCLRRDATEGLNRMLKRKYGFTSYGNMVHDYDVTFGSNRPFAGGYDDDEDDAA